MIAECPRESEALAAVQSHRWPARCEPEFVQHVASCEICRDVVEVSLALREQDDVVAVRVPSSAHMWWRLQVRARQDAARAAARPIAVVQGVAAASIAGLVLAVIGFSWAATGWARWSWSSVVTDVGPAANDTLASMLSLVTASPQTTVLLAVLVGVLVLMPVAVYFALSE